MNSPFRVEPSRDFPSCPICGGNMQVVYCKHGENVLVCVDCHSGLTIPHKAWAIADVKKATLAARPDEKTG